VTRLNAAQIKSALASAPGWRKTGATISRAFQFPDFPAAIRFVNAVAKSAEKARHHPDIEIRWNKVALSLTTHDAGGLTAKDFALARRFDRLAG
jgi:4a-hydroxytetrahydrobiopterin dehydratase